jgi:hypothetical protein
MQQHTLRHAVPSFPTIAEVWLHLLEAYGSDEGRLDQLAGLGRVR